MRSLHENQKRILDYLMRRNDGATLDEIAEHLGVSKTGAKEHLIKIERLGYLSHFDSKGAVGRPRRKYLLNQEAHDAFPKQYSWLASILLELLAEDMGEEEVSRLMMGLADKVARGLQAELEGAKTPAALLERVTKIMNDLGYRAALLQSNVRKGAIIEATNCVYHSVAKRHPKLCAFDVKLIENATGGMNVKLESCIARGGSVCRFCIKSVSAESTS